MFKPSVTVHKSPSGEVKVLACSEDAAKCIKAYKACTDPGEVVYIRKGHTDKIKSIPGAAKKKAAKKAK